MPWSDSIVLVNQSGDRPNYRKKRSFDSIGWLDSWKSDSRDRFLFDSLWLEPSLGWRLPAEVTGFGFAVRPHLIFCPLETQRRGPPAILGYDRQAQLAYQ